MAPVVPEQRPGSAVERPPVGDVALMTVAIAAVSTAGPMIAAAAAPLLAVAFWRNALSSGVLLPLALTRFRRELTAMERRTWGLALLAGVFLALHFGTWISGLAFTTVASAVALVCTQPVWAALIARLRGEWVPPQAWFGIALAVAGAALLTGVDAAVSPQALAGDLLGVAGGVFGAAYVTAGGQVRRTVSTTIYTAVCYGTAAVLLLGVCLAARLPLVGYPAATWGLLLAVTAGPQLLGHTLFNRVLQTTRPTIVSLAMLLEVPGAALIAALWLGQAPPAAAVPAAVLLLAGVAAVVTTRRR
ncbi:MAG: DMT family transporter [Carbonactinosporaceae bacterium]